MDYIIVQAKSLQDNKNKSKMPTKNNERRIFGKEIGNEMNIKFNNSFFNANNKKTKNGIKDNNVVNIIKNKEFKRNENIKNNNNYNHNISYNLIKQKNDENHPNNYIPLKHSKNNNLNKSYILKRKENKFEINKAKITYNKNPIEEYDEVIMKNLFIEENNNRPDYKKISEVFSEENKSYRLICLNLLINLSETFEFRQETIYLTINLFDRYILSLKLSNQLNINKLKNILLACIFIASKYEEIYPPILDDYLDIFLFPKEEILKFEYEVLECTNFELHICSPYLFLTKFFDAFGKNESKKIIHGAQFILDICIMAPEFCILKPSFQAAICLYLSKKFLNNKIYKKQIWSADNKFITGYSEDEIKKNLKIPLKIIKHFFAGSYIKDITKTALFKKYSNNKYSEVSNEFKELFKI